MKVTNIEYELKKGRKKLHADNDALLQVAKILAEDQQHSSEITKRLTNNSSTVENKFVFDFLETDHIYHLNTIKDICIDYRLRFLDTKYFKGEIPQDAISKIKRLEKQHNIEIKGFKLMAPSKLFKLEDKDDPLLFATIGNGYYYLIHKWGNDLHPLRKILVWPFKNLPNLVWTTILISFVVTFLVPTGLFSKTSSTTQFLLIFLFMFKWIGAIVLYFGFAKGKNFNHVIWNSKYFNA